MGVCFCPGEFKFVVECLLSPPNRQRNLWKSPTRPEHGVQTHNPHQEQLQIFLKNIKELLPALENLRARQGSLMGREATRIVTGCIRRAAGPLPSGPITGTVVASLRPPSLRGSTRQSAESQVEQRPRPCRGPSTTIQSRWRGGDPGSITPS